MEKILIYLIRKTFVGRGFLRKHSVKLLVNKFLNKKINESNPIPSLVVSVNEVPFKFYFDKLSNLSKFVGKDDREEIEFLKSNMKDNFTFIDIGANNGFYTQMILNEYPKLKAPKILAIEPNPLMCERIKENIQLLDNYECIVSKHVEIINCAVGESDGESFLDYSSGYGQAQINKEYNQGIPIKIKSLIDILHMHDISKIDALKIDVEGYEMIALEPFFKGAPTELLPKKIVIEYTHNNEWENPDFLNELTEKFSYIIAGRTKGNLLLEHD